MSMQSFDAWFHGVPVELSSGQTKRFDYWLHESPYLIPDVTQVQNTFPLQMRARIVQPTNRLLQMRARIAVGSTKTLSMRGRINRPEKINMRARVARQQGWPIPNPVDPAFPSFQPTQLTMRGRLTQGTGGFQSLEMKASIRHQSTALLRMRARIVEAAYLSMRAHITPRFSRATAHMIYFVSGASQAKALMLFYTQGIPADQSMTMSARIAPIYKAKATSRFNVFQDPGNSPVIPLSFTHTQSAQQVLNVKARIAVP